MSITGAQQEADGSSELNATGEGGIDNRRQRETERDTLEMCEGGR